MRRRWLWLIIGGLGGLLALPGLLWFGYRVYVEQVVARSPSTLPVVETASGRFPLGRYDTGDQVLPTPTGSVAGVTPTPELDPTPRPSRPILPPTRVQISAIGLDAPVVLADNENLPQFKGIGWYVGSGFPGFRGNVVLFGHLNGAYETLADLQRVAAGDEVVITAMEETYAYAVTDKRVVGREDVAVMAPTDDSRLTLITCSGDFIPATRDYTHRLIVVANLDIPGNQ